MRTAVRRGATLVEVALVVGALIMMLLGIMEYGRFIMVKQVVDNATREGAHLTLSADGSDSTNYSYQTTSTIQAAVTNAMGGVDALLPDLTIAVYLADSSGNNIGSWTTAQDGQNIAVEVTGTYAPILPTFGFLPSTVTIHSKSVMRSEGN
jgi:Flp pilus assembly protein TadG